MEGVDTVSSLTIKKIYTENPFVDSLLYYVKLLAYGSVVKLQKDADAGETVRSMADSDLYIISCEGRGIFELYNYSETILGMSSVPASKISEWALDNSKIEDQYKAELTIIAQKYCVDNYIETNEYYRKLMGLPPVGDYGIPVKNYEYLIPEGNEVNGTYIHDLGPTACEMLEEYGILDIIKADYPAAKYLDYVTCGITAYSARKAFDYQIIYMPSCGVIEIDEKFASKYRDNRTVMIKTMYSDGIGFASDYYDNFMAIIVMIMTMADMLTEVQDHIIKKDILDARCIEYIFSVYGIPYFHSIPLKYQIKMVKRVNDLVKNKSCMQGMLNLVNIFGRNDIQIYKYYLLRDRKTDYWGNFLYNATMNISSKENDTVEYSKVDRDVVTDNIIPFPFDYFLQKGNVMFVRLDNHRLDETEYEIYNYNHIRFLNGVDSDKKTITYDFYYDKVTITQEFQADVKNGITMKTATLIAESSNIPFTPPYQDYFNDGNQLIVSIAGTIINQNGYKVDRTQNIIIVNDSYQVTGREVVLIYLYGTNLSTAFKKVDVVAYVEGQTRFTIPEPFKNYASNDNGFIVTIGSTYIDPRRYTVESDQIKFLDTKLSLGRSVTFTFIYSNASIYTAVDMMHTVQTVTATEHYQYQFPIKFPIDNYISLGYTVYVKLRGWFLSSDYFDIYGSKLVFRDLSMALQPNDKLELHFVYGPSGETSKNVLVSHKYIEAAVDYQDTFDINYPIPNYFNKGNKLVLDIDGYLLSEGTDFKYSSDKSQIIILDKDILPYKGQKLNLMFVYIVESEYAIKLQHQVIRVEEDNQKTFYLNLPFYPYLETTQGFIVLHKSLIVDPELITVNKYNLTINIEGIKKDDEIVVIYIYNNRYLLNKLQLLTIVEETVPLALSIDKDLAIEIPVPFDDYIENYWPYFIDYNKDKVNTDLYDVLNNGLLFNKPTDILKYNSLTFVFVYKDSYLNKEEAEDCIKDIDLKFARIPLGAEHPLNYIKQKKNTKSYDAITLADRFWDGDDNQDNAHEAIKEAILKRQFNYARSKYMTIEYMVQLTDMAFEIAYFYNMLYDDIFREDLLTVRIPTLSANKNFKLANVFVYMTALAYSFSGIKDKIMDSPTKIMYVKGFNFKADMAALKQYIRDNRRLFTDYDVFGFLNPSEQIPSIDKFVDIYKNNKAIYNTIVIGMTEAKNHDIYKIWKKLYDSLMVWQFNLEFFKLSNGKVADTLSDFLAEKDPVLYASLKSIKSMTDNESRENSIVSIISDVVYILEEYIKSTEFKYLYMQFPGMSAEYILQYLFTMINFFKSYKVVLNEMNINFVIDDPNINNLRFHDKQAMTISLDKPDYINMKSVKSSNVELKKEDNLGFKEKVEFTYYQR